MGPGAKDAAGDPPAAPVDYSFTTKAKRKSPGPGAAAALAVLAVATAVALRRDDRGRRRGGR